MTRRTQLFSMLGLGSALLLSSAAHAQRPHRDGTRDTREHHLQPRTGSSMT